MVTALPKSGSASDSAASSPATMQWGRNPMEKCLTFSRFLASE